MSRENLSLAGALAGLTLAIPGAGIHAQDNESCVLPDTRISFPTGRVLDESLQVRSNVQGSMVREVAVLREFDEVTVIGSQCTNNIAYFEVQIKNGNQNTIGWVPGESIALENREIQSAPGEGLVNGITYGENDEICAIRPATTDVQTDISFDGINTYHLLALPYGMTEEDAATVRFWFNGQEVSDVRYLENLKPTEDSEWAIFLLPALWVGARSGDRVIDSITGNEVISWEDLDLWVAVERCSNLISGFEVAFPQPQSATPTPQS